MPRVFPEAATPSPALLELLSWVAARPRTYGETMEAWRTSCPRMSTWEDATLGGLVEVSSDLRRLGEPCLPSRTDREAR
jgi:hypothetical protein